MVLLRKTGGQGPTSQKGSLAVPSALALPKTPEFSPLRVLVLAMIAIGLLVFLLLRINQLHSPLPSASPPPVGQLRTFSPTSLDNCKLVNQLLHGTFLLPTKVCPKRAKAMNLA
ncbi:hypothetical protein BASA81_010006 [Batrachochytrium salamandrivorans]|nr:hypothetical protein BASA81_010006 [Batrachochytrium salamandrivorans]